MSIDAEIQRLAEAAVDIAKIKNPDKRHNGGWWLHGQLESLYENHLFTQEQRLDFMAVVKILLDVIFSDAVETSEDLGQELVLPPSAMDKYVDAASKFKFDPFEED